MGDHDDAVKEAPYCLVCRRSSAVAWRKHLYSRTHQEAAHGFLLFEVHRLAALARDANAVPVAACASSWRCVFCAAAVPRADALAHVGTKRHRRRVGGFCRQYRCDADRQMRTKLWLQTMQPSREVREDERLHVSLVLLDALLLLIVLLLIVLLLLPKVLSLMRALLDCELSYASTWTTTAASSFCLLVPLLSVSALRIPFVAMPLPDVPMLSLLLLLYVMYD